jgi:undecaprenyl diphosphate synthase
MYSSAVNATRELKYYTPEQVAQLDHAKIPHHIAFIMDGNRRWAKRRCFQFIQGYRRGADNLLDILKAAKELGVRVITLYAFSTENWKRSKEEVAAVLWLFEIYIKKQVPEMVQQGIRFCTIGDLTKFPDSLKQVIADAKTATKNGEAMEVVFALNYGARDEMVRAIKAMAADLEAGKIVRSEITESLVGAYLDTSPYPDPDLLVRTGGDFRISNYLLWQISYSEIFVTSAYWPEFTPNHLLESLLSYQTRERRGGK